MYFLVLEAYHRFQFRELDRIQQERLQRRQNERLQVQGSIQQPRQEASTVSTATKRTRRTPPAATSNENKPQQTSA